MTIARFVTGDTRAVTAAMPGGCVDLVLTSPPFLALRSYLPADHRDKANEIGAEATPAEFLQTLLELTAEWGRVLAPHGSICVELGDTYAGSGGAGGDYNEGGLRDGQGKATGSASRGRASVRKPKSMSAVATAEAAPPDRLRTRRQLQGWPLDKSLCGIPHLYHLSLAYGRNLLTGERSPAGHWRVRNVVAWCRPNPAVGALGDKFRPATSYLTIATKARDRWFDLDAVRSEPNPNAHARTAKGVVSRPNTTKSGDDERTGGNRSTLPIQHESAGAPPLDWWPPTELEQEMWDQWADELWIISTAPYAGSHYAVYPPALCERPIKAMCPLRVCEVCGEPSRRIVEPTEWEHKTHPLELEGVQRGGLGTHGDRRAQPATLGWTDCGHNAWRAGRVFDPFGGSGTTGMVATGHGRDALLVDFDERNVQLAEQRIGGLMFEAASIAEAVAWLGALEAAS